MALQGQYDGRGPLAVFGCAWHYRQLIVRLTAREIEGRFRGSLFGKVWAALVPLIMLSMYTFVFGVVFRVQWPGMEGSTLRVAPLYFVGMILFDFVFECISRAPALMAEHIAYIKKVLFPLEILSWVVVCSAFFRVAVGSGILLVFYLAIDGPPPLAALAIPILVMPLALVAVGFVWFLSAVGVFVRDFRHAIMVVAPAAMFLSPIFFPLSSMPEPIRTALYINPLTFIVESVRGALFSGVWPNWGALLGYVLVAWLFAWAGHRWFMAIRGEIADVV